MRKLYLGNGDKQFKFADTTTEIHLNAFDDGSAAVLTANAKVRIKNDSGYLLGISASITNNHAIITSGQLAQLPVGSYLLELWDTLNGGTAIYPSDGFLALQINENVTGLSGGLVSSIMVDDFIQQFSDLSQQLKQEVSIAVTNGVKGDKGDDGLSAYQIAVINGYHGSQAEWLASLIGAKGDKGDPGNYVPETFTNLSAIQSKYPTGSNGIMIAADNGHKYIWANSTWTDAGIYQSVGIADNSITTEKYAPKSITPSKMSDRGVKVNLLDNTTYTDGFFIHDNGTPVSSTSLKYTDFIPVIPAKTYSGVFGFNGTPFPYAGVYYDGNKQYLRSINKYGVIKSVEQDITIPSNARYVRLNVTIVGTEKFYFGLKQDTVEWLKVDNTNIEDKSINGSKIGDNFQLNVLDFDTVTSGAYLMPDGSTKSDEAHCYTDYIPVYEGETYSGVFGDPLKSGDKTSGNIGVAYDKNKNVVGGIVDPGQVPSGLINITTKYADMTIPSGVAFIRLNVILPSLLSYYFRSPVGTFKFLKLSDENVPTGLITDRMLANSNSTMEYKTTVDKPFVFSGKTARGFGDSIMIGHTTGVDVTPNNFAKLLCDKLGMTFTNSATSGALITSGYNSVNTIPYSLQNTPLDSDYILIAGGTNDYGLGVPLAKFESAVTNMMSYLKANYKGEVIVISPINRVKPSNDEQAPLAEYRKILGKHAMLNEYSFINGGDFNFPSTAGEYNDAMFGDGLHPSELGHRVYAVSLATYLA